MRLAKTTRQSAPLGPRGAGRRGIIAVEFLLVLPVLLTVVLGMLEFGLLLMARQELLAASREGARVAAHGGGDTSQLQQEVAMTVKRVLGPGHLGDSTLQICFLPENPQVPQNGRQQVQVTVQVPATHVVPNLLAWTGFSIANDQLTASTIMNVE